MRDAPKFAAYGYDRGLGTWESPEPHPDLTAKDWIWSDDDKVKRWDRTRWMVNQTLAFLEENRARPCFINLWLDDTHTPWVPSAEDQEKKQPESLGALKKVTRAMDSQIGRLIEAIRERKSDRPTFVLFLGDNGPLPTFEQRRTGGLRGSKLSLYEGGIRVPALAWGPGLVRPGVTNRESVISSVDLLPSLVKLAGAAVPGGSEPDGEDLSEALLGNTETRRSKPLFWEYGRNNASFAYPKVARNRSPNVAMRQGDWKLLVNDDGSHPELYDLGSDPRETVNLAASRPEIVRNLTGSALHWRRSLPR